MKKIISILLSLLLCISTVVGVLPMGVEATITGSDDGYYWFNTDYGTTHSYIKEIGMVSYEPSWAEKLLGITDGWDQAVGMLLSMLGNNKKILEYDLNDDAGGAYVFIGWNTTTNPSEAITGLQAYITGSSAAPAMHYTENGVEWHLANSGCCSVAPKLNSSHETGYVDLNEGAGGSYIYLYVTKDQSYGPPLSDIVAQTTIPSSTDAYSQGVYRKSLLSAIAGDIWADFNNETGDDPIYLIVDTNYHAVDIPTLRELYNTAQGFLTVQNPNFKYVLGSLDQWESEIRTLLANWNANKVVSSTDHYSTYKFAHPDTINSKITGLQNAINAIQGVAYFNAETNGGSCNTEHIKYSLGENPTAASKITVDLSAVSAWKDGYRFLGWNTDKNATTGQTSGTVTVDPGTQFYAIFSKDTAVTFHYMEANNSIAYERVTGVVYNRESKASYTVPSGVPTTVTYDTKTYTLSGWRADTDAGENTCDAASLVSVAHSCTDLYAVYTSPVTVSFDTGNGSVVAPVTAYYRLYYGTSISPSVILNQVPTKEYYHFMGWATEANGNVVYRAGETISPTADTMLYAVWEQATLTVTVNVNDSSYGSATGAGGYNNGDTVTLTAIPNTGYEFVGWMEGNNTISTSTTYTFIVTHDSTFTAAFAPISYTVTWLNADGSELEKDVNVPYGTLPTYDGATPTKAGDVQYSYTFAGWDKTVTAATADVTYTATYTQTVNTYTVTWMNGDGSELEKDVNVPYGSMPSYDGATPTKATDQTYIYTFAGWDKEIAAVTGDVTYTATYTQTAYYTVTLEHGTGYTLVPIDSTTVVSGSTFRFTVQIADGYKKGSSFAVELKQSAGGCAFLTEKEGVYTLSNLSENVTLSAVGVVLNTIPTLPTPTNLQWNFTNGVTATWGAVTGADGYAVQLYSVANNKDVTPVDTAYTTSDTSHTFDITAAGDYCFTVYAYANISTSAVAVSDKATFYEVRFDEQGHGTTSNTQYIPSGSKVAKPTDLTFAGYTFGGWYKQAGCIAGWDFENDTVTADTTLYAKWTQNPYDLMLPTATEYTVTPITPVYGNVVGGGDNFSFTLDIAPGYSNSAPVVKVNGVVIPPDKNGIYTVYGVTEDLTITVEGVISNTTPIPIQYRLDNFATTTGEFKDVAYFGRAAKAGDIVTLKVSLSELGEKYGLDYRKIRVEYETQGAVLVRSNFDYFGNPIYKDGIASEFMLSEGFNKVVAKVYYNGSYVGAFAPFYCNI